MAFESMARLLEVTDDMQAEMKVVADYMKMMSRIEAVDQANLKKNSIVVSSYRQIVDLI